MVIVGPYLIHYDHLVQKGVLKRIKYICHICLNSEVKVVKRDYILALALYTVYHIFAWTIFNAT